MAGSKKTTAASAKSSNGKNQDPSEANVDLGTTASEVSEQIQDQVSGLTQQVRQQASEQFATQKERLADTLDTVALLLHQAGEHADLQDKATVTGYVAKASSQVSQWSETLRERDVTQLLDDTVQYARRQPMVFFSGALAAGFAGARFLRSSTQSPEKGSKSAPATEDTPTATDTPHFDSDQAAFNSALPTGDTPSALDLSTQTDREPEMGDFVEDYKAGILEGDELIDGSLSGTLDTTSPEQR